MVLQSVRQGECNDIGHMTSGQWAKSTKEMERWSDEDAVQGMWWACRGKEEEKVLKKVWYDH